MPVDPSKTNVKSIFIKRCIIEQRSIFIDHEAEKLMKFLDPPDEKPKTSNSVAKNSTSGVDKLIAEFLKTPSKINKSAMPVETSIPKICIRIRGFGCFLRKSHHFRLGNKHDHHPHDHHHSIKLDDHEQLRN